MALPTVPLAQVLPGSAACEPRYFELTDDYREMMVPAELDTLCRIAAYWRPERLFEFGTYLGGSALQVAANSEAEIYTLDLPPGEGQEVLDKDIDVYPDEPGRKFHGTPYESRIHQLYGNSLTFDYSTHHGLCDMVFVDANHHYEHVCSDTDNALKLVRPGGLVLWHDYADYAPGVMQALDELAESGRTLFHIENTSMVVHLVPREVPDESALPFVTVVLPSRNGGSRVGPALASLARQDYPAGRFEILAIDNGSTDGTKAAMEAVAAAHPSRIRYIDEPEPGLMSGRHRGVAEARGDVVTFTDDDILAHPHWLAEIAEGFADPDVHCVGGRSAPQYAAEPPDWVDAFWSSEGENRWMVYLSLVDLGEEPKAIDPLFVFGLNFSIRKQTFLDLGGTHPDCIPKSLQRFQGDGETGLANRLKSSGLETVYRPGARLWHVIDKERLTIEAWESHQFYHGVCDSFTRLRANGGEVEGPFEVKKLKRRHRKATDAEGIRRRLAHAHERGFAWHQREVRDDPALRAWVLKEDYLDYRLPEGWRAYADASA